MRIALVHPNWSFDGSIYFGCRAPHLPIELGCAKALLEREGHEAHILDGQLHDLSLDDVRQRVRAIAPDMTVVTTAPTYLFWRCPPPELRVPREVVNALEDIGGTLVAIGPHPSTTPGATLKKLGVDVAVLGESEEILVKLAASDRSSWPSIQSIAYLLDDGQVKIQGSPHASDLTKIPPLVWTDEDIRRHAHHHHRFEAQPKGPGAEVEWTRGCPYHCSFCNKENFRDGYRKRPLENVLAEIDRLIEQGIEYLYFIDEIFLPDKKLLEAMVERPVKFGVQMRIDNWTPPMLELLGQAGCVSVEAGMESITVEGRSLLQKKCKLSTEEMTELLVTCKQHVPFVQANLLDGGFDDPVKIEAWRSHLQRHGVWANKPVPMFPYPGTPDYRLRWGLPDDRAWERAHEHYLKAYREFSDIQEAQPRPLPELEAQHG